MRAATTANGTLASAFANSAVIDGVTLATGDRILLKDQTTGSENGIYTVNASGAPTRAADADAGAKLAGASVLVREGTVNAGSTWSVTTAGAITLGSTSIALNQTGGYFLRSGTHQWLTFAANFDEIRAADGTGGFYTAGSYTQVSSDGGIEIDAHGAVSGGGPGDKHWLYGGNGLVLPRLTADPSGANSEEGQIYSNTTTHKVRYYNGTTWNDLF